jgi:hypothetical protein
MSTQGQCQNVTMIWLVMLYCTNAHDQCIHGVEWKPIVVYFVMLSNRIYVVFWFNVNPVRVMSDCDNDVSSCYMR